MCVRVFSVGFGPGLDSMSPARSRRSAGHSAGTHCRLSPKNWVAGPPERRGRWIQFAQCSPRQSPRLWHCGTPTTSRLYPFGAIMFALIMLFLCMILHIMSSGKSIHLLCILPFGMLCLSAISMMFVKILLAVCILVGMVVWAKADTVSSGNCVQSAFLLLVKVRRFYCSL